MCVSCLWLCLIVSVIVCDPSICVTVYVRMIAPHCAEPYTF